MESARILRDSKGRKAEKQIGHAGNEDRSPERYPARGIKERASKWRDSGADSGRKTSPNKRCWPFRRKVGGMLRRPPRKGPKRSWRRASLKAWLEANDSWKKSVSWKTASRHYSESRPTKGVREWTG